MAKLPLHSHNRECQELAQAAGETASVPALPLVSEGPDKISEVGAAAVVLV
jgi:hypothetical protein